MLYRTCSDVICSQFSKTYRKLVTFSNISSKQDNMAENYLSQTFGSHLSFESILLLIADLLPEKHIFNAQLKK